MSDDLSLLKPGEPVDVTNCDREPIHIPGRIQPHGVLLALQGPDLQIIQASDSTGALLGIGAEELLGKPLGGTVLNAEQAERLRAACAREDLATAPLYLLTLNANGRDFDTTVHRSVGGELILELEPVRLDGGTVTDTSATAPRADYYGLVKKAMPRLHRARSVRELSEATADEVRQVSGYDRVMVYRFDADGHGSVIAESKREDLPPFLGLHYPASDIPQQARRLYLLNTLRVIVDVEHAPAPMLPEISPLTGKPLDMSHCVLRSPSPIHIEYLKNMGVDATLTISLIHNNQLWGLIACHHYSGPRLLSYDIRAACEFLGQAASLLLTSKQESEDLEYRTRLQEVQTRLIESMSQEDRYQQGLIDYSPDVSDFVDASGAAVFADGECLRLGAAPPEALIRRLVEWLAENTREDVWATDSLPALFPEAEAYKEVASGLLAVAITRRAPNHFLLWFRPEVEQTVEWAGDPRKAVTRAEDGSPRLSPRGSFELWRETVRLRSLPWRPVEIQMARDLRRAIVEVVLKKAEQVARLNAILARSNHELDSFAYIASHDLKEPLRGINNYAYFLLEDYGDRLDDDGRAKLQTLGRLTQRMEGMIDSLLSYSRVGRLELEITDCDLNQLLADVQEDLRIRLAESGAELRVPRPLPTLRCDRIQVGEILGNLISNAAKYNDKPQKWIEVGYLEPQRPDAPPVLYVRDNGIGIRERHFDAAFRLFKRLHGRDEYGGGTGAGLTIARKIAERHGGRLWLESVHGEGTTFYFTLGPEE